MTPPWVQLFSYKSYKSRFLKDSFNLKNFCRKLESRTIFQSVYCLIKMKWFNHWSSLQFRNIHFEFANCTKLSKQINLTKQTPAEFLCVNPIRIVTGSYVTGDFPTPGTYVKALLFIIAKFSRDYLDAPSGQLLFRKLFSTRETHRHTREEKRCDTVSYG